MLAFRATYAANLQRGPELLAIHDALSSELDLLGTPPAMDDAAVETEEDAAWWECLDRVIGTAVDYAKRRPGDVEAFEGRPNALKGVDAVAIEALTVISRCVKGNLSLDTETMAEVQSVANALGHAELQMKFAEVLLQTGNSSAKLALDAALNASFMDISHCSTLYTAFVNAKTLPLDTNYWLGFSDKQFDVKRCLNKSALDPTFCSENVHVDKAISFLDGLLLEPGYKQLTAGVSATTDSDVPIDKSVWVRVLREFLRLKDAVLTEERSRDSRDAGGWVLVHKDLARAILTWRKECGKVHGWAGEEQDLGEDLMNQGKELMEEINGGVVSVVSEFAVTYLDDKMREMDAALAVLEPCAGGGDDGTLWFGELDAPAADASMGHWKEKFDATLGSEEFDGEALLKATERMEQANGSDN